MGRIARSNLGASDVKHKGRKNSHSVCCLKYNEAIDYAVGEKVRRRGGSNVLSCPFPSLE